MAQSVLRTSGASMTALFSPNPLMSLLRDWLILPLLRLPVVSRALVSRTSQLDVNYRASALSAGRGRGGRVRAGDRHGRAGAARRLARDPLHPAPVRTGDAELADRLQRRFGDVVRVCRLVRDGDAPPRGPGRILCDRSGGAHRRYGAGRGALLLVRPDGYVGVRARPNEGDAVVDYLSALLPTLQSRLTGAYRA